MAGCKIEEAVAEALKLHAERCKRKFAPATVGELTATQRVPARSGDVDLSLDIKIIDDRWTYLALTMAMARSDYSWVESRMLRDALGFSLQCVNYDLTFKVESSGTGYPTHSIEYHKVNDNRNEIPFVKLPGALDEKHLEGIRYVLDHFGIEYEETDDAFRVKNERKEDFPERIPEAVSFLVKSGCKVHITNEGGAVNDYRCKKAIDLQYEPGIQKVTLTLGSTDQGGWAVSMDLVKTIEALVGGIHDIDLREGWQFAEIPITPPEGVVLKIGADAQLKRFSE